MLKTYQGLFAIQLLSDAEKSIWQPAPALFDNKMNQNIFMRFNYNLGQREIFQTVMDSLALSVTQLFYLNEKVQV